MQHLAAIMDGNRRWAKGKGLPTLYGHQAGLDAAKRAVDFCLQKRIRYLSLYAFSLENFKRSKTEKEYLFTLIGNYIEKGMNELHAQGVRINIIGERSLFPESVKPLFEKAEQKTAENKNLVLNLLFCYGSQQEIVASVKTIAQKVKNGELAQDEITQKTISEHLWTAAIPAPDLILRTGGEKRLSNFLLYQAAYSEFYFTEKHWPEINQVHLNQAFDYFNTCKRNFGS